MTNKELAAQCLIEAAELLNESAGANGAGGRYYDELIKKEKEKLSSLERKAKQYEHAVYEDKGPNKEIEDVLDKIKKLEYQKSYLFDTKDPNIDLDRRKGNARFSRNHAKHSFMWNGNSKYGSDDEYMKHAALHDRINERGERAKQKSKNESIDISSLLREAADLLDE